MKLTFTENAMQRLEKLGMTEELSLYMSTIYGCGGPDSSMFTIRAYDTKNPYYDTVLDTNFGVVRVTRDSLQQLDEDNASSPYFSRTTDFISDGSLVFIHGLAFLAAFAAFRYW